MKALKIMSTIVSILLSIVCLSSFISIGVMAIHLDNVLLGLLALVLNFFFWVYFYTVMFKFIKRGFRVFILKPMNNINDTVKNNVVYKVVDENIFKRARVVITIQILLISFFLYKTNFVFFDFDNVYNVIYSSLVAILTMVFIVNLIRMRGLSKLKPKYKKEKLNKRVSDKSRTSSDRENIIIGLLELAFNIIVEVIVGIV